MISRSQNTKRYCREPLSNVENYEVAVSSPDKYELHHRDEIKILPSGVEVRRSKEELIENGRYFNCPANELIFLPQIEHRKMHNFKYRHPMYGKVGLEGEKNPMWHIKMEDHPSWKGDDATEQTKRNRGKPYRRGEARRLRRLRRLQRNAERVQAIQETKGVL